MRTDEDVLRDTYRFVRSAEDDAALSSWEASVARGYDERLFREYAIADLARAGEGQIGLRWRVAREVLAGVGEKTCGAAGCTATDPLATFELPFAYEEANRRRAALVKVRLCPEHAEELMRARAVSTQAERNAGSTRRSGRDSDGEGRQRLDDSGGSSHRWRGGNEERRKRRGVSPTGPRRGRRSRTITNRPAVGATSAADRLPEGETHGPARSPPGVRTAGPSSGGKRHRPLSSAHHGGPRHRQERQPSSG